MKQTAEDTMLGYHLLEHGCLLSQLSSGLRVMNAVLRLYILPLASPQPLKPSTSPPSIEERMGFGARGARWQWLFVACRCAICLCRFNTLMYGIYDTGATRRCALHMLPACLLACLLASSQVCAQPREQQHGPASVLVASARACEEQLRDRVLDVTFRYRVHAAE